MARPRIPSPHHGRPQCTHWRWAAAELVRYEDAAHSFLAEASSVVAAEVVSFLYGFDAKRIAS